MDKTTVKSVGGDHELTFEYDFDKRNDTQTIQLSLNGGSPIVVDKETLLAAMFVAFGDNWQEKIIPTSCEAATTMFRMLDVMTLKDMKAGEMIKVKVPLTVPNSVLEGLARERHIKLD